MILRRIEDMLFISFGIFDFWLWAELRISIAGLVGWS